MTEKEDNKSEKKFIIIAIIVTVVIIGLWGFTYLTLKDFDNDIRGTFGDMFGSVNALFSGLALAGIILTILLQRKELKLQREELKETREEFKTQNETLKIQRFENTFFNLLNQHHQIVDAIDFRYYKKKEKESGFRISERTNMMREPAEEKEVVILTGRDVFRYRYNQLFKEISNSPQNYAKIYIEHYKDAQTDFGHYFRNLYRMIKHVDQTDFFYDNTKVSKNEIFGVKYKYTSIIRAQISDYELMWLFYNCLSSNGIEKFKPYVEKYSFFKNLPQDLLGNSEHKNLYQEKAFKPTTH